MSRGHWFFVLVPAGQTILVPAGQTTDTHQKKKVVKEDVGLSPSEGCEHTAPVHSVRTT